LVPFIRLVSRKTKLIYDTHELETETNGLKGLIKAVFKISERCFISSFSHVFVVSPSIEKWYRKTYGISNITTVLNCPASQQVYKHDHFRQELGISSDSKIFLYQGALFKGRGIEDLLEAFKKLNNPKYSVVFMGYGECDTLIKKAAEKFPNIFFYQAVPPEIVLEYTSSADFGLSLIENVCLSYYYCLPNKIFEYLMAGLPCIVSNIPELKGYVDTYKVGVVSETNSSGHIIESVLKISNIDFVQMQNSVVTAQNAFNWENESRKMIYSYRQL
jgi:glycosyltransferase involved in cell wall biosynthesis